MSTVQGSTGQEAQEPRGAWWDKHRRWWPALGPNELASTEREWAAKPPPGMESEPITQEWIDRTFGT